MDTRLPFWLTLFGAVPFVLLSVGIAFDWTENVPRTLDLLLVYAAIIFSFLGGIHWGLAVLHTRESSAAATLMMAESMVAALLAWGIMALGDTHTKLLCFAFLYAVIWGVDSLLYTNKIIPLWFFNLRGIVTPVVVVSMYVAYFSVT